MLNKISRIIILCTVGFILLPVAEADKPKFMSLTEAVRLALRYNQAIDNAKSNRIFQKFDLRIAENAYEFQYALGGTHGFTPNGKSSGDRSARSQKHTLSPSVSITTPYGTSITASIPHQTNAHHYSAAPVSLNLSQPLLRGAGRAVVQNSLIQAYDKERINKLTLRDNIATAVNEVASQYRGLIQKNNDVDTAEQSLKEAKRDMEIIAATIKAGKKPETDIIQAEATYEDLKFKIVGERNDRDQARQTLLETIGLEPEMNIRVPHDIDVGKMQVPDFDNTLALALKNNKSYQETLLATVNAKRSLHIQKNAQLPELTLSASTSFGSADNRGYSSIFSDNNRGHSVGLKWSVPINDLSRKKNLLQSEVTLQQALVNERAAKRKLITSIKNFITNIRNQIQSIKVAERNVKKQKRAYDITRKKQTLGRVSSLEVSSSQKNLIDAQKRMVSAKIAYLNAMDGLRASLGTALDYWNIELKT